MGIRNASARQVQIAKRLGIDVSADSFSVAAARILDLIEPARVENPILSGPTPRQQILASELGIDVSTDSYRVTYARIQDKLLEKNLEALEELQLAPGDRVVIQRNVDIDGKKRLFKEEHTVSSTNRKNGLVYLKGVGSRRAWAGQLIKWETSP